MPIGNVTNCFFEGIARGDHPDPASVCRPPPTVAKTVPMGIGQAMKGLRECQCVPWRASATLRQAKSGLESMP